MNEQRRVEVITDLDGKRIVVIHDVIFKNRQNIEWDAVKDYLYRFAGKDSTIELYSDKVYIGPEFPEEYTESRYTRSLKGTLAKAKANAAQGIPELIRIATGKKHQPNHKKIVNHAANGNKYLYDMINIVKEKETGNPLKN